MKYIEITYDEHEKIYEPLQKDNGDMVRFDKLPDAVNFIKKTITDNMTYRHIWSVIDNGEGIPTMMNGRHICNILHYEIALLPWGTEDHEANGKLHIVVED